MRIIPLLAALGLPFFAFADNEAAAGCIAAISEQYDTLVSTPIESDLLPVKLLNSSSTVKPSQERR